MKTRNTLACIITLVLVICAPGMIAFAQIITSTGAGGNWETTTTWIGGVVPTAPKDVVIAGPVAVTSSNSTCRNITINSGAILQNGGGLGWITFVVQGNITNNGTIRNNPVGNAFYLDIRGDIYNGGLWRPGGTYPAIKQVQHISMAPGTKFENEFSLRDGSGYVDTNGVLIATTALTFTDQFDMHWRWIDMNGHALTLKHIAHFSLGTIKNATDIFFEDTSYMFNTTISGNVILHGRVRIDGGCAFLDDVVNSDFLEHSGGLGWVTPVIYGKLTNNGTIRNNPESGYALALDLRGDIHNAGIWQASTTNVAIKKVQHISQTPGTFFDGIFRLNDASGYVDTNGALIAASDLVIAAECDLKWRWLDMDSFKLTLIKHGHLSWGTIKNVADMYCGDSTVFYNTIVGSNVTLHGSANIDGGVSFLADVTVADTMRHWGGLGWVTPVIYGSLINNGVIMNNPENNWGLAFRVFKNITNNGRWKASDVTLDGTSRRTIDLRNANITGLRVEGKKVEFVGINYVPTLSVSWGALCFVASEATLTVEDGSTNYGSVIGNLGRFVIPKKTVAGALRYEFYYGAAYFNNGATLPDSVVVESFGRQTPKSFGNSVESWYRVRTVPPSNTLLQYLDLYYLQTDLNGIAEKDLRLYQSTDAGASWVMVDPTKIIYHDSAGNYMRIKDVPCSGDYVLAAEGSTPVPARSNIRVSVIGNTNVRVGAPNRMIINLYNNSDEPSGNLLLTLDANQKIGFLSTEDEMDAGVRKYGVNDFATDSTDQEISFFVRGLGPREDRDFTINVTATGTSIAGGKSPQPQFIWFIAAAAVYVAGAYIEDYVTDKMVEGCFKAWMPANATASDKVLIKQTLAAQMKAEAKSAGLTTGKQLAEDGAKKLLATKGLEHLVWPAKMGLNILSCIENAIKGMQCYLGQTPIKDVFTHIDCNGSQKEVRPAVSRDPNQKSGPVGFGAEGFVANASRMEYMIECENAPNAEAAAYKIVIIDSLAPEFDETSVVFGRMSHAYTATRTGNILRWEITGIDLPANKKSPEGESWVLYSVMPKAGLPTGTVLGNRASIVFDLNAPIVTNRYINTLDYAPPITTMRALPSKTNDTIVTVKWMSNDPLNGSGYESAMLYMAKDDGNYIAVGNQDADSAQIIVPLGHSYSFFSLAKDNVGNLEMNRPVPVSIRVASGVQTPSEADFWLRDVYPNPTNAAISLDYSLTRNGLTSLTIIDELGRIAAQLSDEFRSEGVYHAEFNCTALPTGAYYIRLEQGGFVRTKKFVVAH